MFPQFLLMRVNFHAEEIYAFFMKDIYIGRDNNYRRRKNTWIWPMSVVLAFMLLCLRVVAPYALQSWINKQSVNEKGYALRVGDIDLKILKGDVVISNVEFFNINSRLNLAEAFNVEIDFDIAGLIRKERFFSIKGEQLDIILSKEFFRETFRFDQIKASFDKVNIREMDANHIRTVLHLKNILIEMKGNNSFAFKSAILEGGDIALKGSRPANDPWVIEGRMTGVNPDVMHKISGDELPFRVSEVKMNALIKAEAQSGSVEGVFRPDIKTVSLPEAEKPSSRARRSLARVKNVPQEPIELEIPFTLNEKITLDFDPSLEKIRKRNL